MTGAFDVHGRGRRGAPSHPGERPPSAELLGEPTMIPLGPADYAHAIESILRYVAPELGWR